MMRRNVICQTMGISFTVFPFRPISARFAQSLLIYALSDSAEGAGGAARGGGGGEEGETDHFSVNLQKFPLSKMRRGKVRVLPSFFPDLLV